MHQLNAWGTNLVSMLCTVSRNSVFIITCTRQVVRKVRFEVLAVRV